jgi:hypothetical protein
MFRTLPCRSSFSTEHKLPGLIRFGLHWISPLLSSVVASGSRSGSPSRTAVAVLAFCRVLWPLLPLFVWCTVHDLLTPQSFHFTAIR